MPYVAGLIVFLTLGLANANNDSKTITADLLADYAAWIERSNPDFASGCHDHDVATDYSLKGAAVSKLACHEFEKRATALLLRKDLTAEDRHATKVMQHNIAFCFRGNNLFAPVSFIDGVQVKLPASFSPVDDMKDAVRRLGEIPGILADVRETLEVAVEKNMTYPAEAMDNVLGQFKALQVEKVEKSAFYTPFRNNLLTKDAERFRAEAKELIVQQVLPAFQLLGEYLEQRYMKRLRPAAGVWSIPGGREFYQTCLDFHMGLKGVTAEHVHSVGLASVRDLQKGMCDVGGRLCFGTTNFSKVLQRARTSPALMFNSSQEALDMFTHVLQDRINGKLDCLFLPEDLSPTVYQLEIALADETVNPGSTAFYVKADAVHTKGIFYVNLNDLTLFRKSEVTALTLHEGNPGHHLQVVFQTLHSNNSNNYNNSAYDEGWALYSEYLGLELGLYDDDPSQLLGFYSMGLLRSARLVVDTGLHYFGWSKQEAVTYLLEHTAVTKEYAEREVNRYITWPGQAVAYRMGEMVIRQARDRMESKLGDNFDLRRFHSTVLKCSGPMFALEDCLLLRMN